MKYLDKIENKHRVVRIGKAPQYDGESHSIAQHLERFPNSELTKKIRQIVDAGAVEDYFNRVERRGEEFKALLFSTWKMCLVGKDGNKDVPIKYVFPYKYYDTNNYLFFLESIIYDNFFHINGLTESSADVTSDDFFARGELVFYEVDFTEMLEHAKQRCDEVAEARLIKIIERDHELITDNNE